MSEGFAPEAHQLQHGAGDAGETKKLTAAVTARMMVHGDLGDAKPAVLGLFDQLDAKRSRIALQADLFEDAAADQAEVAVYVPHAQPEPRRHRPAIELTDDNPREWIVTGDLVALHQIAAAKRRPQQGQLAGIILGVSVGVEDEFLLRRLKAAAQRPSIAAVAKMVDDAQARMAG